MTQLALLLAGLTEGVEAGFVKIWRLRETASAPVLVAGRVLRVQKGKRVPVGSLPWKEETWAMTAEVEVLRSYSSSGTPLAVQRISVHFLRYGSSVTGFANGYPPELPLFKPGMAMVLPLQENGSPASAEWRLTANSGMRLTIPTRAELMEAGPPPETARAFLVREIANTLSRGTPQEVTGVAEYLARQDEDLTGELLPRMEPVVGGDRQRWARVATNILAAQGIPRPSVADLFSEKGELEEWRRRPSVLPARAALQKLKASPETDALLIKTWIAEAPWHAWGSANSLVEYADHPVTTEAWRKALRNDLAGTSYIAWTLAHSGHQATLPEALARALRVADRPDGDLTDLQGAAALLRDFGNDDQLKQLAALVEKYRTRNREFYHVLWQYATMSGNPREARVLAVVLRDRRIVFDGYRYCDVALGTLERAVGQQFGSGGKTVQERDAAVSRALAWLKAHGISE